MTITLKHLCKEFKLSPHRLRETLRSWYGTNKEGRWKWDEGDNQLIEIRGKLGSKAPSPAAPGSRPSTPSTSRTKTAASTRPASPPASARKKPSTTSSKKTTGSGSTATKSKPVKSKSNAPSSKKSSST